MGGTYLFCFMLINSMYFYNCENATSSLRSNQKLTTHSDVNTNHTKSLITEGGIVETEDFNLKGKDDQNLLLVLDQEGIKRKEKPSVRRNGAVLSDIIPPGNEKLPSHTVNFNISSKQLENNTHTESNHNKNSVLLNNVTTDNDKPVNLRNNITNDLGLKPRILSSEALSETVAWQHKNMAVQTKSLQDKLDIDQETGSNSKIHVATSTSHPDLVMPVVITILIVPLFAVVGYMALQKGREAWKNRHYKRMDFLVDGMYNE